MSKRKRGGVVDPIPYKQRRNIAYDYWCTKKSGAQIAKEHNVFKYTPGDIAREFDRKSFTKDKPFSLLKVAPEDLEKAVEILYALGIKAEIPPENSELIEHYESTINDESYEDRERETA